MHENANITYQNQESNKIMETILSIQPRVSAGGSGGKSPDEIVMQMADEFEEQLP
jgi:dynein heavy chain